MTASETQQTGEACPELVKLADGAAGELPEARGSDWREWSASSY
jgi:hypothetical protein